MAAPEALVSLSRRLGDPTLGLAILAEGNTSTTDSAESGTFWVKASGRHLGTIEADGFVAVTSAPLKATLEEPGLDDASVKRLLQSVRVDSSETQMPSVETFMHAYLLGLPGVSWIGHTHPVSLLALLCTPSARKFAKQRLFPDDVVCCGPESCFVPYCDPGVPLARAIKASVEDYQSTHGESPKTIWLANHGLIALGSTPSEVVSASLMSEKSAKVWLGAIGVGEPNTLSPEHVSRIAGRPDEHYRQSLLRKM
jgi:rhamnose utilization protein RhaD (predicted bifunctional aldolase and dehydrogenase)